MDVSGKVPLSHTLWSPYDTVKDAAELLGISLPDDAARNLAMDVEYRIHEILETAIKFMRHSKRKLLTTDDVAHALKLLNIEPLYGYDPAQPLVFKEALVGALGQTLYYIDEHEIEFEKLINQELPRVPRQASFTAHWLAIEGVQPMILQNPLPADIRALPPIFRGSTLTVLGGDILVDKDSLSGSGAGDALGNGTLGASASVATASRAQSATNGVQVKPLVKHVLLKELQLYFDKVAEVLVSTDAEKETLKYAALTLLRNDPGLHQLVPYLIQFVAEQITNQLRNFEVLLTMLEVLLAFMENKTIFLDPYVHALMPCILTLLLAKRIGPSRGELDSSSDDELLQKQLAIREFAAILLQHIVRQFGSLYTTMLPRITRTLLRALLDPLKPIGTHYGALLGLQNMGAEVIQLVLVGNLKTWVKLVVGERNEAEQKILLNTVVQTLRKLKKEKETMDEAAEDDTEKMEVESGDIAEDANISYDIKEKLQDRIGAHLLELSLTQKDAKQIVSVIFFGEVNM